MADPALSSFICVPPESHFPIQNLPYGVFRPRPHETPRIGVAIGDWVVDLSVLEERGLLDTPLLSGRDVFQQATLNGLMALGPATWREARAAITRLLRADVADLRDDVELRDRAIVPRVEVEMCLPCQIGDYTDFYCSIEHASNVGRIFRGPDAALPPNFRHMPIGYHGRASSIVVSGTPVPRPCGQHRVPDRDTPEFGPSRELDFELEVGLLIGCGNELGRPISTAEATDHIFGLVLVNDWSARDIQQWEYHPLGPFLGKNFATTISPWVVPLAALEPFRCDGPPQEPRPLDYLRTSSPQALDIHLEVGLRAAGMDTPATISRTNSRHLYWSAAQMIAHHTSGGCNLRPGDLLASGTVSGPTPDSLGCLLELSQRGARPVTLPGEVERSFLGDGDTVVLSGFCKGTAYRIGFGDCVGRVLPASS